MRLQAVASLMNCNTFMVICEAFLGSRQSFCIWLYFGDLTSADIINHLLEVYQTTIKLYIKYYDSYKHYQLFPQTFKKSPKIADFKHTKLHFLFLTSFACFLFYECCR